MKTMAVSQFKAKALGVLDRIAKTGEAVMITRHGKPLAKVEPIANQNMKARPGKLAGTVTYHGDIVAPLGEDIWEACHVGSGKRR